MGYLAALIPEEFGGPLRPDLDQFHGEPAGLNSLGPTVDWPSGHRVQLLRLRHFEWPQAEEQLHGFVSSQRGTGI